VPFKKLNKAHEQQLYYVNKSAQATQQLTYVNKRARATAEIKTLKEFFLVKCGLLLLIYLHLVFVLIKKSYELYFY
jgi:hypothetical protein